jgi:hypothetical protein
LPFIFTSRADELETALMEMVKQDNRRELSAKVNIVLFTTVVIDNAMIPILCLNFCDFALFIVQLILLLILSIP